MRLNKTIYIFLIGQLLIAGCVSHIYKPGNTENLFNKLKLGQNYGDMIHILGDPDKSSSEDRTGYELAALLILPWAIVESIWDFNPSSTQTYTYNKWGAVTMDNNNCIIRIEAN